MNKTFSLVNQIPTGPKPPKEVYCFVEIPKGSVNKYEYNKKMGVFVLDRVLYESVFFPAEYGIIPRTLNKKDGDPLDIMVLSSFPTFAGCLITSRPIGLLRITDSGEKDDKIIGVPANDPRFDHIKDLSDLPPQTKKELSNFWENYSELQPDKKIKIDGWSNQEAAWKTIEDCTKYYQEDFEKDAGLK